jgi:hypothetical protein
MSADAAALMDRLGLSEDELATVLAADPVSIIGGDLEHRPELGILLALTGEAAERVGPDLLRRWLRTAGPSGRPVDHLLARDFPAFESAIETLAERGFVIGG